MLIDLRTYRILPGRVPAQLDLYSKLGYPVQLRYMGEPLCYLVAETGAAQHVLHGWVYESAADREAKRAKMVQDPDWKLFLAENAKAGHIIEQKNWLMTPTAVLAEDPEGEDREAEPIGSIACAQRRHPDRRRNPDRPVGDPRRAPRLLRAGRKLSGRARRLSRQRHRAHRLPARERRRHDGRGGRQGDRPPRHLLRHARAGRHQCLGRHPYRAPGFLADDRVRRPGRSRYARARGVPGARLPRGVRHHRQMGDRNRRPRAHPGTGLARLPHRLQRPSRAGGDRAAGRHAGRARRRCPMPPPSSRWKSGRA